MLNELSLLQHVVHEAYAAMDTLLLQSTLPEGPVGLMKTLKACAALHHSTLNIITFLLLLYS